MNRHVRKILVMLTAFILSLCSFGQFENKLSLELAGGIFIPLGPATYGVDKDPYLMSNFETGWALNGGVQFNVNRHFSILADFGFMYSGYWYYDPSDPNDTEDDYNYLYYEVYEDTISWTVAASGENELTMFSLNFGLTPKYYFMPEKKLNPYIFTGISLNYSTADFEDHEYEAWVKLGMPLQDENDLSGPWIEKSFGIGVFPGIGLEYNLNDKFGFFLQTGYQMIFINETVFDENQTDEDFHSIKLQAGFKFSFLRSKDM